jgi:hypothetical protein
MSDAEKAYTDWVNANHGYEAVLVRRAFMAGRASREADVTEAGVIAERDELRAVIEKVRARVTPMTLTSGHDDADGESWYQGQSDAAYAVIEILEAVPSGVTTYQPSPDSEPRG